MLWKQTSGMHGEYGEKRFCSRKEAVDHLLSRSPRPRNRSIRGIRIRWRCPLLAHHSLQFIRGLSASVRILLPFTQW